MPQLYAKKKVNGKTYLLHRWLMEQHVGRPLRDDEIVHHKNAKKLDNRLENLEVMSRQQHSEHHNQKHPRQQPCVVCGEMFTPTPTKRARKKTCSRECFAKRRVTVSSKLTTEQRTEIRTAYTAGGVTQQTLAERYGVTRPCIGYVVRAAA